MGTDETSFRASPEWEGRAIEGRPEVQASIALTAHPTSPYAARRFVGATLDRWGRGDLVEVAVLLTSEMVTNAFAHEGTEFVVSVTLDGDRARVAVRDEEVNRPRLREPSLGGGHGLALLDALAVRWGTFPPGDGKALWFEL